MSEPKTKAFHYFIYTLLGISWGANFIFMSKAVQIITPMQVVWMRVFFGAVPIWLYGLFRGVFRLSDLRHGVHFIIMAFISTIIPFIGLVKATQVLPTSVVGAFSGTVPLVTAFMATVFLKAEKTNAKKVAGLMIATLGVCLVVQVEQFFQGSGEVHPEGILYALLACLGFAAAGIYTKKFLSPLKLDPVALAAYQTLIATIILTASVPLAGAQSLLQYPAVLTGLALGLGLCGTGIAFIMYYYIIEHLGAVTAASVFYIPPIVALAIGTLVANENFSRAQMLGTAFILAGVYVAKTTAAETFVE